MIKLTDNLYLDADQHQYILGRLRQRRGESGERVELRDTSYYTTIASALSAALQGFLERQQQMLTDFTALIEPFDPAGPTKIQED